jgi:protein-tyrosine-phosphatase
MKKVLVLCTGNSCRSQIAEGYLKFFANGKAEIYSAGIETHGVNPKAIATMAAMELIFQTIPQTMLTNMQTLISIL